MTAGNLHATMVVVGDRGIVIQGHSGSGKTTLALALIASTRASGRFAALVADDQVLASNVSARLSCTVPNAIAGLIEVRGSVPSPLRSEGAAIADLVVRLVPTDAAPRFAEAASAEILGCEVPLLAVPERNVIGAMGAIAARLRLPPFV